MVGFEMSIMINRPIEEVFGILANLENDLKWRSEWVEAKNTSGGAPGVGATFILVSEFLGRRIETLYEATEYEPNRIAAWKAVSGPLPLKFQRAFEAVDGGTQFSIRYEAEISGAMKLVAPLIKRMGKQQHEGDMRKLKELMEAHAL